MLHYKWDLCRLNFLLCRTNCPFWATFLPHVSWCLHVILPKPCWAEISSPPPKLRIWTFPSSDKNSTFLILHCYYHHQIRVWSSHGLPCIFVKTEIQQLLSFLSKVLCIHFLLWSREYRSSELHLSIGHFQYVSVVLMEKYGSPPVVKIIPLISHRW